MRITRSFAFHTKYLSKRIITISILTIATIAGLSSLTLVLQPTKQASAITPPDTCFAFNSATGTITDYYNNENNDSSQPACPKDVDIPSQIGGVAVTAIGSAAFWHKDLISVTIPNTVISIGNNAFFTNQLTAITIPSSVTNIGASAFTHNQLTSLVIPSSVTTIGGHAFKYNQLSSVTLPNSITSIGDEVFHYNQLTDIVIPSSVTSIGDWAFAGNQLTHVDIPNSVTSIGQSAFSENLLTSFTFSANVTVIGDSVFYGNKLTSITIPSTVTTIESSAFAGNHITTVTVPSSVTSIDPSAFMFQGQWGGDILYGQNGAPNLFSTDSNEVQQAYDSLWYARLYTEDPTNPNGLTDYVFYEAMYSMDLNSNGHMGDSFGGHLINPASLDLHYVNQDNTDLQTSQTFTGQLPDDTYLHNYYASQGPAIPVAADPTNPTLAEEQAIQDALSVYYRIGNTVTITPPVIDGYITPQTKTFVLGSATNNESYIYTQTSDGSVGQAGEGSDGQLAETGMSMDNLLVTAGLLMATSLALLARRRP